MKTITLTQEQYEMLSDFMEYHNKEDSDEGLIDYANEKIWNGMMKAIRSAE